MTREELLDRMEAIKAQYGEWVYDIPLPHGVWTKGNLKVRHQRLKRVLQVISDLAPKPLEECRILDLGCLDGIFSIELAHHGAEVVGIDARRANIVKAEFCREALGLDRLSFVEDDVRNFTVGKYGEFDIILCSGILYHLDAPDVFYFLRHMYEAVRGFVVIDTHFCTEVKYSYRFEDFVYHGAVSEETAVLKKIDNLTSAFGNDVSFWFTKHSLMNALANMGFSSVFECFIPVLFFEKRSIADRSTFIAVKGRRAMAVTSPEVNDTDLLWSEFEKK